MDDPPKPAYAVRRSACDQCRAKRVRCLRAENSTAPCARCSHTGTRCVTGAAGHPGRPRNKPPPQQRLVDGGISSTPSVASPADISSSSPGAGLPRTMRDDANPLSELHTPDRCTSWLDDVIAGGSELAVSKQQPALHPSRADPLSHPDFWEGAAAPPAVGGASFLGSPPLSIGQNTTPTSGEEDILALMGQMSGGPTSHLQGPLPSSADDDDDINAMLLHMGGRGHSATALDMDIDPLLLLDHPWEDTVLATPSSSLPQSVNSAASSKLMRFREEMVQRIAALDAYFSDPLAVMQACQEDGGCADEAEAGGNPAALLLTCSQEFIDIIQSLTPTPRPMDYSYPHNRQLVQPDFAPPHMHSEDGLSTEILLLALSSYLALMRLFDSLFHCIHKFLRQMPPDSFKSVKVKSVLRIGGISSLQDVPLKTYATGILDVVRGQVRTLERCMGVSADYCLSSGSGGGEEAAAAAAGSQQGIFSRPDRARLFCAVMAQEDVKSRRGGGKSYVESIRASIQDSVLFLE